MVFSKEVCSTFTAMSSRTLLSDHVCDVRAAICKSLVTYQHCITFLLHRSDEKYSENNRRNVSNMVQEGIVGVVYAEKE